MANIDTFEKLEKALDEFYDSDDWETDFYKTKLTAEDKKALKNIVLAWGEKDLKNAHAVLADYYAMKVPSDILRKILSKNLKLALEVYGNGIRDTSQREVISYEVMRYMGMRDWPTNGEGRQAMIDFVKKLKETAPKFGIEFTIDIENSIK
jgi:hypothetical protein